ncbi:MAG: glycoside hydrolase family 65 protein [Bacteroidales bacterium]|nr:glycoside hydrolase family 65 protein [Bacteroidales bacterium]
MNHQRFKPDAWKIIEEGFETEHNRASESIFSIGNGKMGQRGNFEEDFSGDTLQGHYLAGIYYPDKTKVGWWKNGYPEYFAKILNAPNWIGIHIKINGTPLDLAKIPVSGFRRILDMKEGTLKRSFTAHFPENTDVEISVVRFLSMADDETGAIRYMLRPLSGPANISLAPYLDADVKNEESNYGEKFWEEEDQWANDNSGIIQVKTKKLDFRVATGITCHAWIDGSQVLHEKTWTRRPKYLEKNLTVMADKGNEVILYKFAAILSSLYYSPEQLIHATQNKLQEAVKTGFEEMLISHQEAWAAIWKEKDFLIHGDLAAQQGIRFNIFQLHQTYTGKDERLNIGPKGFTGEKYGGSTYWDTEAFAFPFYLYSGKREIARNLLLYRYRHLPKAIDNAGKLGFIDGAALYPMVTMNGEECHNEWEITFEEIHRNGAIAYAIHKYINYTGRYDYLFDYGLEVLIALSRFWSQRVNYSEPRHKYVILGVTGPNEYENNVNNNWYTNYIARWTLLFSLESVEKIKQDAPDKWKKLIEKVRFREKEEISRWKEIAEKMYFPEDQEKGIFLQQDGYLDKEQITVDQLDPAILPLNQHWSWDRILRSCFIKQADVLQGLYFFEEHFDRDTVKRNFSFYEPRTVHESSLSPCVHSVLASRTGNLEKAYALYLRTSRLDLDDYNKEVSEGLHITSMAGTWLALVEGFAGLKIRNRNLYLEPRIPPQWVSYEFQIRFHNHIFRFTVSQQEITIEHQGANTLPVYIYADKYSISPEEKVSIPTK